jgi:putative membrane protein
MMIGLHQALAGFSFSELWDANGVGLIALLLAAAYLAVTGPLRSRIGPDAAPPTTRHRAYFLLGCLSLYLALGSPLDVLSDNYLLSAHMLEHMLLVFAFAPLVLAGLPEWLTRIIVGRGLFRRVWATLTSPAAALGIFITVFSAWHAPFLYDLTLTNDRVHLLEHLMFIAIGFIVWWPLLSPLPEMPRLHSGAQLAYLFIEEVLMTVPFAMLTFASTPFYTYYVHVPRLWGITPLQDQAWGGFIMRIASALSFGVTFAKSFFAWFASQRGIDPIPSDAADLPAR